MGASLTGTRAEAKPCRAFHACTLQHGPKIKEIVTGQRRQACVVCTHASWLLRAGLLCCRSRWIVFLNDDGHFLHAVRFRQLLSKPKLVRSQLCVNCLFSADLRLAVVYTVRGANNKRCVCVCVCVCACLTVIPCAVLHVQALVAIIALHQKHEAHVLLALCLQPGRRPVARARHALLVNTPQVAPLHAFHVPWDHTAASAALLMRTVRCFGLCVDLCRLLRIFLCARPLLYMAVCNWCSLVVAVLLLCSRSLFDPAGPIGYYCPSASSISPCPSGTYGNSARATTLASCLACPAGNYAPSGSASCSPCSLGSYCPAASGSDSDCTFECLLGCCMRVHPSSLSTLSPCRVRHWPCPVLLRFGFSLFGFRSCRGT